jgi:hypothetical protein
VEQVNSASTLGESIGTNTSQEGLGCVTEKWFLENLNKFGKPIAFKLSWRSPQRSAQVLVVNTLSESSSVRYAVIEALRNESSSEQFVIAYRNEQLLREFVAAPCIIATGFLSRYEAAKNLKTFIASTAA